MRLIFPAVPYANPPPVADLVQLGGGGQRFRCADDHAHLDHEPGQQPGYLHLARPYLLGDVGLGALFIESQLDQAPLVFVEVSQSTVDDQPGFGTVNILVGLVGAEANPSQHCRVDRGGAVTLACEASLLHCTDRRAKFISEISGSRHGAHLLDQRRPLPPDGRCQLLSWPWRAYHPAMIAKVPLEYAGDRRHGKANERPLMRVKSLARFDQSCTGDLQQVILVLAAM